jgi:hypothetical protein
MQAHALFVRQPIGRLHRSNGLADSHSIQSRAPAVFAATWENQAPALSTPNHIPYQQRLLATLIRWTSLVFAFGIIINSLWFLVDFWNTAIQNSLVALLLLIGAWCIRQTRQGQVIRAGRVYLGSTMVLLSLVTLLLGDRFILNTVVALGLIVFIAAFLERERVAMRWTALSIVLYVAVLTVRIFILAQDLSFGVADLFGLYAFPTISLSAFGLLGSSTAKLLAQTLGETKSAHDELKRSHRTLQGTEAELQEHSEQLRRELSQRKLAEETLARKVQELKRSRGFISALSQVAAHLNGAHGPKEIMATLGAELKQLGMTCVVALLDPDEQTLAVRYTSIDTLTLALGEKLAGITLRNYRVPYGVDILKGMIKNGHPVSVADAIPLTTALLPGVSEDVVGRLVRMAGLGRNMAVHYVPLTVAGEAVGAMAVWGQSLQEDDLAALSVLATQVAGAIQSVRTAKNPQQVVASRRQMEEPSGTEQVAYRVCDSIADPLTTVMANVQWLLEQGSGLPRESREMLLETETSTLRIRDLLHSLRCGEDRLLGDEGGAGPIESTEDGTDRD